MKLSVVIVSYKVKYYLEQCLLSLYKAIDKDMTEIFVIDNHSGDGSVEYLEKRFPHVRFVNSRHNLGFARANNLAIRKSRGQYVLLLNPDTIVDENAIRGCLDFMDSHPEAGSCGIRMAHIDGTDAPESRRGLPTPMTAFYKMCGLCAKFPKHKKMGRYYMGWLPWDSPQEIEVVSGAFCMIRRSVIDKVGLLDEDFFMYGEDIDLSYRIIKGGYKNYYLPLRMLHYKGESSEKSSFRYVHVFYDAMLIFFRKHYSHFSLIISLPINLAIYGKALIALIRMQIHVMKKSLGFFVGRRHKEPNYIFIGTHLHDCQKLAEYNGLEAQFIEGNINILPNGHNEINQTISENTVVVYDTKSYSYSDILRIFASNPQRGIFVGTYNPSEKILITCNDVYTTYTLPS